MRNKGVIQTLHSFQFRTHTPVFVTLLVACVSTLVILSRPSPSVVFVADTERLTSHTERPAPISPHRIDHTAATPDQRGTARDSIITVLSPLGSDSYLFLPFFTFFLTSAP